MPTGTLSCSVMLPEVLLCLVQYCTYEYAHIKGIRPSHCLLPTSSLSLSLLAPGPCYTHCEQCSRRTQNVMQHHPIFVRGANRHQILDGLICC
ncbi:hypothetical protein BO99DRAFT_213827 [Aspergillus violaceofuscus CBS 115571]|uniref:Secreted protein n=1 Tax=Aspergillus violaceofuscus (strain CBS 115571) TaxID=1450538 RepID=A0A2V5H563_ASPV1|nr:hypothetical protein BO99DRAFT_213827 [Aspergillus violaceofuscus CBS 115571]